MASPTSKLIEARAGFQTALLRWFRKSRRPLPWRNERSLYRTVVSEFMLQQTQVKTVLPFFDAWMRRFPDFASLAAARESAVLKAWEGLGYYSRARNLHSLAKAVVAMPKPPADPEGWLDLPGVGPYTAAAISSIACGARAACIDGNIVRVLARLTNSRAAFTDNAAAAKHFTPLAAALLNKRRPGDHNEALMELGATVCTKASPACPGCPVSRYCAGFAAGDPGVLPRIARRATVEREVSRAFIVDDGLLLLHKAHDGARRLAGLHELPEISLLGLKTIADEPVLTRARSITHHKITERIFKVRITQALKRKVAREEELSWVPVAALDSVTLSGPHKRWVGEILQL